MSLLLSSLQFALGDSSMPKDITQTPDGDYIIVGRIYNTNGIDSGFSTKIAPDGTIIWEKIYSSSFTQFLESVALLDDGSYIATGLYFYSQYFADEYLWVINFDSDGNILWQKAYGQVGIQSDGSDIEATKDGGFIVTGISIEETSLTWVLKFDSSGNLQWDNKYSIGKSFAITQTIDEGYALIGSVVSAHFMSVPFILRLDYKGNVVWQKTYNDYNIYALLKGDIIETSSGHLAIVAKTLLMEVDSIGNEIFAYVNEDLKLNTILQTSDNNYCISGSLIVRDVDHAYIATIDRSIFIDNYTSNKKSLWDNVDIKYSSEFNKVFIDTNGLFVGCGFFSTGIKSTECFLSIFDPNQNVFL